jgi:hypothetical protein
MQITSTDAGMQTDFNDEQFKNALSPICLSFDPDSNVNDSIDWQLQKHFPQISSTDAGSDSRGTNNFGICLDFGKGVDADISTAAECYRTAALNGHVGAQNNFGFCLEHGIGVDINLKGAFVFYRISANQGHTGTAFHCALCLHYGIGVDIDLESTVECYAKAYCDPLISMRRDSFRCLRALRQTQFVLRHFPEVADFRSVTFESWVSQRPLVRSLWMHEYVLEQSDRDSRPPEKSVIGCDGFSTVFLCNDPSGTGQFVIKRFERSDFDPSSPLMREVESPMHGANSQFSSSFGVRACRNSHGICIEWFPGSNFQFGSATSETALLDSDRHWNQYLRNCSWNAIHARTRLHSSRSQTFEHFG